MHNIVIRDKFEQNYHVMNKFWKSITICIAMALLCTLALEAQSSEGSRDVIIIEKVKDENGNIISKKIIRSSNGDLSDEEIEKALDEYNDQLPLNGILDLNNFDLNNLGLFDTDKTQKPTLGVMLSFESGEARITNVQPSSGAEDADLRENDIIVSLDGMVVNTIEDIKEYIADKEEGESVLLSIIRDGQSFEKRVELKKNNFNNIFGNIDPSQFKSFSKIFNFENGEFPFSMDSLLRGFDHNGSKFPFQFDLPNYSDKAIPEDRPSLGVFIDESDHGVIISDIVEDSAAERANLKVNDKILKIDGNDINTFEDLARLIRAAGKDTKLLITYMRNGKTKEAEVILN